MRFKEFVQNEEGILGLQPKDYTSVGEFQKIKKLFTVPRKGTSVGRLLSANKRIKPATPTKLSKITL